MATSIASCSIIERSATLVSTHPHRHGRGTQKSRFYRKDCTALQQRRAKIRPDVPAAPMIAACTAASPPPLPWIFPSLLQPPQRSRLLVSRHCRPLLLLNGPKSTREPSILWTVLSGPPLICQYTRIPTLSSYVWFHSTCIIPFSSTYYMHDPQWLRWRIVINWESKMFLSSWWLWECLYLEPVWFCSTGYYNKIWPLIRGILSYYY